MNESAGRLRIRELAAEPALAALLVRPRLAEEAQKFSDGTLPSRASRRPA
jgi:hypothetical protein